MKRAPDMVVAKHAMIQHQRKVIQAKDEEDEEDTQSVYIRRKLLYSDSDAFKAFSQPSFNVSKMLKVTFIGEGAVDDGGPRREFFSILMRDTFAKSGLFCGSPENVLPIYSIQGVADNHFYIIGKMISTSIVQGGQPPLCFSRAAADFIVFDKVISTPCLEDIPDYEIREHLKRVSDIFKG